MIGHMHWLATIRSRHRQNTLPAQIKLARVCQRNSWNKTVIRKKNIAKLYKCCIVFEFFHNICEKRNSDEDERDEQRWRRKRWNKRKREWATENSKSALARLWITTSIIITTSQRLPRRGKTHLRNHISLHHVGKSRVYLFIYWRIMRIASSLSLSP